MFQFTSPINIIGNIFQNPSCYVFHPIAQRRCNHISEIIAANVLESIAANILGTNTVKGEEDLAVNVLETIVANISDAF